MDRAKAETPVFPICPIAAQPGHLQTCTGYLQIGLDLRIPTVPKNLDFHFWIGRKIRKTEKAAKSIFEFDQPSANYCCWSYLPTFARCAVPLELPLLFCWASHGFKWLWNGLYSKWTGTWAAFCIKRNESFSQKMAKRCQLDITNWHHIKAGCWQQCMALH